MSTRIFSSSFYGKLLLGVCLLAFLKVHGLTGDDLYYPHHSENFIIRWGFQDICDHVFDPRGAAFWPTSYKEGGITFNPEDVKAGDIIFVRNIDMFMKQLHPHIEQPYFMLTHGEHLEAVWSHHLKHLESKKIIGWASIHPPKHAPEKFFTLPLGVQQHRRYYDNKADFTNLIREKRAVEKTKLLYLNVKIEYNKLERERTIELLSDKPFTTYRHDPCSFDCYMSEMAEHKFVLSPRGLGPDCYRTWEALLIGTIPIVRRNQGDPRPSLDPAPLGAHSLLDDLYDGLPVLIIDSWEEINEEFLNKKYAEMTAKKYDPAKLYMEYWRTKIYETRNHYLRNHGWQNQPDLSIFGVDCDISMGKNDPYMHPFYEKLIIEQENPDHRFSRYLHPHLPRELITLCRKLYADKPAAGDLKETRIPRIFHQIWVGGNPLPEKYKRWQKTWQSVPGWSYKLWTDKEVEAFDFPLKESYYKEKNVGARADILRIEILNRYGGVYIDTDFECIKPEFFDLLNYQYDFYSGLTPFDRESCVVNNGLIGSIPEHPILKAYIEHLLNNHTTKNDEFAIVNSGPGLFTRMILLHANKGYRDIILPPTFFYPLGIEQMREKPYSEMPDNQDKLMRLKQDTCRSETIAIHWWEGSWKLPDSWK